jgi:mannose-1-phosphate guanylyltransferase/mannose-6-phosphate isomerase
MAAVCWSVWSVDHVQPDALIAVLPADAYIGDVPGYQKALNIAFAVAEKENRIVCLGIKPTSAATGYGYIQQGPELSSGATEIARFIEKPDEKKAQELFSSGQYLWNAGIFVFPAKLFMNETRKLAPEFGSFFDKFAKSSTRLRNRYKDLPKISVDVALMEKTKSGALVPGDFGWNDIGSWPALAEVLKSNSPAGIVNSDGGHLSIDSQNCIVDVCGDKFVGLIGVKDLIVVETEGALLVCHKDEAQKIKDLVGQLEKDKKLSKKLL